MNPASTRHGSSRTTLRPRVLDVSSPSESQVSVASAVLHQGPSVPGTPTSQGPSVPRTPTSQGPSVPGTPTSQGPSVPRTPIRLGPSAPRTPSRQRSFVRATPSSQRPLVQGTSSSRSLQSVHRDRVADKLPKKHIQPGKVQLTRPVQGSKKIKIPETIKIQAEGQDRTSKRFRDSFRRFCFSANGMLKILRMCITAASVFCFIIGGAQELFVVIMIQETCIILFFIIIYLVTLQNMLTCIRWPLLDLINTLISTVFIGILGIIVIGQKSTKDLRYTGGILCLLAAILCVLDALLATEKMRHKAKNSLARETKPSASRPRQKQR